MASLVAVFSTAVGFLIGAYMPLGMLPTWVQTVCAFIPGTYSCALLRYSFMATPIEEDEDEVELERHGLLQKIANFSQVVLDRATHSKTRSKQGY